MMVPEPSFAEVFQALENGRAELGVVPVENSTDGGIRLTLDLLIDTPLAIVGEILLPIRHALLSRDGNHGAIRRIVSRQESLAQCHGYLAANYPRCAWRRSPRTRSPPNARQNPSCAAIASVKAAAAYGLKVIAENIRTLRKTPRASW